MDIECENLAELCRSLAVSASTKELLTGKRMRVIVFEEGNGAKPTYEGFVRSVALPTTARLRELGKRKVVGWTAFERGWGTKITVLPPDEGIKGGLTRADDGAIIPLQKKRSEK